MLKKIPKKRIIVCLVCSLLIVILGVALMIFTPVDIPNGSIAKIVKYTRNKPYERLSIAIITPVGTEISVYGHDGKVMSDTSCEYEIGEITQTFLGAIAARAMVNGDISLETKINEILPVPGGCYVPTVSELVTCRSHYGRYLPEKAGKNGEKLSGINDVDILMSMTEFPDEEQYNPYIPSQFGAAVLGTALADLYHLNCFTLFSNFIHLELGLRDTYVPTTNAPPYGNLWNLTDTFISSCGIVSTISDMSSYVRKCLTGDIDYLVLPTMAHGSIDQDHDVGFFWEIKKDGGVIVSRGSTAHYSSVILMNKASGNAVVVLSNYPDDKFGRVEDIASAIFSEING